MTQQEAPVWVPFLDRKDGVEYVCETCLDYGGLLALNTSDHEGLPLMMVCPDCQGPDENF